MTKLSTAIAQLTNLNLNLMNIIMDDSFDKLETLQWIRREAGDVAREARASENLDIVLNLYRIANKADNLIDELVGRKKSITHYYPETKKEYKLWMEDFDKFDKFIRKIYQYELSIGYTVYTPAGQV